METSLHQAVDTELPRRIGNYETFLQIGAGGMADVYLGVQRGPFDVYRLVAIKRLRQGITADPRCLSMFISEARIALRLNHPNVVHTYELLHDALDYCLVMEFLEGQSLLDVLSRIERIHMPLHEHVWILTQLLAGLHYAHQVRDFDGTPLQIVHSDVTPSNVFVCRNGTVKLLDFGIAKVQDSIATPRPGMLNGKLGYVAPEQCLGLPAGVPADIYAVGVMLWEAMARRRRVSGETSTAQVQARVRGSEPPIERVWPQAPPSLAAIARRALSPEPKQRFESACEFQRALEEFLIQEQSQAGAATVNRLLRPYFEHDEAAQSRAIESYITMSKACASGDALPPMTHSGVVPAGTHDDTQTTPIAIDHALLLASRLEVAEQDRWQRCSAFVRDVAARVEVWWDALLSRLPISRRRANLAMALAAVGALAATGWAAMRPQRDAQPRASVVVVRDADVAQRELLDPAPAPEAQVQRVPAPPAPPAPVADLEIALDTAAPPQVPVASPPSRTPARTGRARSTRAARQRASSEARARAAGSLDEARIEPGMDFPVVGRSRFQPIIDPQDPYEP